MIGITFPDSGGSVSPLYPTRYAVSQDDQDYGKWPFTNFMLIKDAHQDGYMNEIFFLNVTDVRVLIEIVSLFWSEI